MSYYGDVLYRDQNEEKIGLSFRNKIKIIIYIRLFIIFGAMTKAVP